MYLIKITYVRSGKVVYQGRGWERKKTLKNLSEKSLRELPFKKLETCLKAMEDLKKYFVNDTSFATYEIINLAEEDIQKILNERNPLKTFIVSINGKEVYKGQSKKEAMNLLEKAINNGDEFNIKTNMLKRN